MKPVNFQHSNTCLTKPSSMTDERCESLHVWSDGEVCISSWKLSFAERLSALLFGTIWLTVLSGRSQPPVALRAKRDIFNGGSRL